MVGEGVMVGVIVAVGVSIGVKVTVAVAVGAGVSVEATRRQMVRPHKPVLKLPTPA